MMHQKTIPLHNKVTVVPQDGEGFIDLDRLVGVALRHWRLVALCVLVCLALGIAYLVMTPPTYTTSTRILLDQNLARFTQDDQPPAARAEADSMVLNEIEILKSKQLATSVVNALGLARNEAFLDPPRAPLASLKAQVKALVARFATSEEASAPPSENARIGKAVALLQAGLSVERMGRSYVIEVGFRSPDPELAGQITRTYAQTYLADQLDANFEATQRAALWLQQRIDDLRESSQAASLAVETYRAEHGLTTASGELLSDQQLSDLNEQLMLAQAETAKTQARYRQFQSIVEMGPEKAVENASIAPDQAGSSLISDLKQQYSQLGKRADDIATRFGQDHPQAVALRREQSDIRQQIFSELQRLTASYRNDYEVARSREESLRQNVSTAAGENSQAGQSLVKLRELEQRATALSTLYQNYLARYEEATQQQSLPIAKARVISQADNPVDPSSPKKSMVLALSMVLGLFAGGGIAALLEFRERYFRTGEDVSSALDTKFLGYLPSVPKRSVEETADGEGKPTPTDAPDGRIAAPPMLRFALDEPASSFAETLRNVKIACDVSIPDQPSKVIGFLSVLPHEGKTTVAANFANLLAANGLRTVLIDADLRNPSLGRRMSMRVDAGLVETVIGQRDWKSVARQDSRSGLVVLPSVARGHLSHTAELLSSAGMADLLANLRQSFNYVVVDLPPLGPVVDAKAFEPLVDGFVFVSEWGSTPRALVRSALTDEPQLSRKMVGLILNKTDMKKLRRYSGFGGTERYASLYSAYYTSRA
ncbi:Wzz/FepE/Etk N-terminal domain-containing protein [Consotaella aegiceratis]|uniref:Wzz/FepE/Etk N-terminal domain-containing protein n=1 Tax=Consotaella aegiceratis TaxID=3097961 RepID=UPI002F429FF6